MIIVWILLGLIVLVLAAALLRNAARPWTLLFSEGDSRSDMADRFEAYLRTHGIHTRFRREDSGTAKVFVRKPDVDRARSLLESYRKEN